MRISKPKFHSGKHISKPPSLQLTGYPSADSSTGGQTGSRGPSPTHNNSNLNEKKVIYKFKSGETFVSFPYLIPQKIIGEGSYACVSSAIDTRSKKKYAIKKNRNAFVNIGDAKRILREIKLMYHFQGHPNLMSVIDVIPPDIGTQQKFKDVYLIMPKMHMTLSKLIMKSSIGKIKLYECDIQTIMYQMCRGLEYMHSGGVIHRNIRPENILINCYFHKCNDPNCNIINKHLWQARITDFSLVRGINDNKSNVLTNSVAQYYRAPEILSLVCCNGLCDCQIDVWSLGCIISELYTRKPLWKGKNSRDQLTLIFNTIGTPRDTNWITTNSEKEWVMKQITIPPKDLKTFLIGSSELAQSFIRDILIMNPHNRPTISQVINHPFLSSRKKDKHYKICPKFNISFEFEKKIKTSFGVRHMMYEELVNFHKKIIEEERVAMIPNKIIYPKFGLSYSSEQEKERYELLVTGYINYLQNKLFSDDLIIPGQIAKLICLFSNLCFKFREINIDMKEYYKIYGPLNNYVERMDVHDGHDVSFRNIYNTQELKCFGCYCWKLKVKKVNKIGHNLCDIGLINVNVLKTNFLEKSFKQYGYGKRIKINNIDEVISVEVDFNYDNDKGLVTIYRYPEEKLAANLKWQCMIAKNNLYRFAIAMREIGMVLELFHYSQSF
eukprot:189398_1